MDGLTDQLVCEKLPPNSASSACPSRAKDRLPRTKASWKRVIKSAN